MSDFVVMIATICGLLMLVWLFLLCAISGMENEHEKRRKERLEQRERSGKP